MRHLLLIVIRVYWFSIPEHRRRPCLFKESCSHHVYRITSENGIIDGLKALKKRFRQCRPGYTLYKIETEDSFELRFKDGGVIRNDQISKSLLPPYIVPTIMGYLQ
jgi:uncharacterized protein